MAKKPSRVTTPIVPTVVPVEAPTIVVPGTTTALPLTVGTPVPNAADTVPPTGDNAKAEAQAKRDAFLESNAKEQAGGALGQAMLGREIGRWAWVGEMVETDLAGVVVKSIKLKAVALGRPEPTGTAVDPKGPNLRPIISKMRQCFRVGALPVIGRAAIDMCYDYAASVDEGKIFPALASAARVQRDNADKGVLTLDQLKELLKVDPKTQTDDEIRLENLRGIRAAIDFALNVGVLDISKAQPAQSPETIEALNAFKNGALAAAFKAMNAHPTAAADKAAKELASKREAMDKAEAAYKARVGSLN